MHVECFEANLSIVSVVIYQPVSWRLLLFVIRRPKFKASVTQTANYSLSVKNGTNGFCKCNLIIVNVSFFYMMPSPPDFSFLLLYV